MFHGVKWVKAPLLPLGCTVQNKDQAQEPWGRKAALSAAGTHHLIQMQTLIYADRHTCTQTNMLGFHPSVWRSGLMKRDDIFLSHTRSHLHKTMLKIFCKGSSQVH